MAHKDKIVRNPVTGMDIKFIKTAADTGGELLEMESTYNRKTKEPPPHYHPYQAEEFTIVEGELYTRIDGVPRIYKKGESFHIPARTVHSMWSNSNGKTILNWKTRPAMHSENFFETIAGLANDGKINRKGRPGLLQSALIVSHFSSVFRLSKPPIIVQKILFGVLHIVARIWGTRLFIKNTSTELNIYF